MPRLFACFFAFIVSSSAAEPPATEVFFRKIQLSDKYLTEGASIGDINADGKPDIVAGPLWWQGPDFKTSHSYAPVKVYPINNYSANFFTFPDLITRDKWTDILKVGLPGEPAQLAINPGEKPLPPDNQQHRCEHRHAQDHICNESPQYVEVLKGQPKQLLAYSKGNITLSLPADDPRKPWQVLPITPPDAGITMWIHGLGAGDIDGDGLQDILEKRGWWQQPEEWDRRTPWNFHPFAFAPEQGGAQMFAYDIDGDGDNDVVTALNAHSWGMAWYEQIQQDGKRTFKQHIVMTDKPEGSPYGVCFSQPHAMDCVDIDGDGIKDIVTGKCYYAHNGRDPGAEQPAVLYWFCTTRHKNGTAELIPYQIDDNSGVGRQVSTGDLNQDGKVDIVVGNKKGVFAFIQSSAPTPVKTSPKIKNAEETEVLFFEAETLQILQKVGDVRPQDLHTYGIGLWSGDRHLWWTGGKPGDTLELSIPVKKSGIYRLGVGMTKARDYGVFEISMKGKDIPVEIDLYNESVIRTGTVPLGQPMALDEGIHTLEVKNIGANPKALKSYMFALDYLILHPGDGAALKSFRTTSVALAEPAPKKKFTEGMGNTLGAKAKSMAEQLALFNLPDGFTIENVSHEGLGAIKPISLGFDDTGRLWTQTATEYPNDNNPSRFKAKGNDRILVFPEPHLTEPQEPFVFADGLVMPISVLPHDGGVHVIHGTEILNLEDTDADGRADRSTVLMSGFGVRDSHTCAHRLTRGPGNWIYFSQGVHSIGTISMADGETLPFNQALIGRYRPNGTGLEVIGEGMNNIWAWAINREGRTYIHEANDLGYSQAAFERDTTYPSFLATASRNPLQHPPTSQNLGLDGTGFCGIATAGTSDRDFPPEWRDFNFVANPITGEINTVSHTVDELGNHQFKREADLVTCDDPMFRPVNVAFGPDGCLYIADWYNRTISHGTTTRNLDKHARTLGRIWRVRHQSQKLAVAPKVADSPSPSLIRHLTSGNLWEMRAAIHQIGKRESLELIPQLKELIRSSGTPDSIRIHALWALEALHQFDPSIWESLLASENQNVRHEALRSLSNLQPPLDSCFPFLQNLRNEKSYYVLNELIRFFRDTPQDLNQDHIAFARHFFTPEDLLPQGKVQGWKKTYFSLGGSYEKRFLNQLIDSIGKERTIVPAPDEERWSQVLETFPSPDATTSTRTKAEIARLSKLIQHGEGDLNAGRQHFAIRCAACHDGTKGGFAPPLGGGAHRSPLELMTAILDPNEAVEGIFYTYKIVKNDGSILEGFRSGLDHQNITLTFIGGGSTKVPISEIKDAGYIKGKSVMPGSMFEGMGDQDFLDLTTYLQSLK
ncbi:MAG: PVC-type heme-binding CxxCH protein [Verrucomicrobiales bacterium]